MKALVREAVKKLAGYVPGEQTRTPETVKLNTNENPYPPSPAVAEALAGIAAAALRLYPDPASSALRAAVAALHGTASSRVFVGNGSDEILALCTRAFVEDGATIGYFSPSYSLYPVLADIRGAGKQPVELGPDFEWMEPPPGAASLFFLTYPNAPTGVAYPRTQIRAFCRAFQGVVVLDEAYADFATENCLDLAGERDNVLVVRSLSKGYSLAGLRVGYAVGAEPLIDALHKIKDSYNVDAVAQALALAALSDPEHMRANVERVRATRAKLTEALTGLGFSVTPSQTNFVWVRPAGMGAKELFERLRARHILVRYFPGRRTGDFLRITVGTDPQIHSLLEVLQTMMEGKRKS